MPLLDEENIRIIQTMKEFGPRNLQQIARKSKLPYSTVYARVGKLGSLGMLTTLIHPRYSGIGLARAMVLVVTSPGKESLAGEALRTPGYWLKMARCTGEPNGYYSLHAIPASNRQEFELYLDQLVTLGLVKDYQIFWLGESHSPIPNFDYYDPKERSWRFDWTAWLRAIRNEKDLEIKKSPVDSVEAFDKRDLIILKELMKDARITLADLAKMLEITLPAAKYRFDGLSKKGLVADYIISILPFVPELSDLSEIRLDFPSDRFARNSEKVLARLPFVMTITPIRGLNSLTVRIFIPRQEASNLFDFLSRLAGEGILTGYSYLHLDPSTLRTRTIAYTYYTDESGWRYDNRQYLQTAASLVAGKPKLEAEQTSVQSRPPLSLQ